MSSTCCHNLADNVVHKYLLSQSHISVVLHKYNLTVVHLWFSVSLVPSRHILLWHLCLDYHSSAVNYIIFVVCESSELFQCLYHEVQLIKKRIDANAGVPSITGFQLPTTKTHCNLGTWPWDWCHISMCQHLLMEKMGNNCKQNLNALRS